MIPLPGGTTALIFAGVIAAGAVLAWRTINGQHEEIGRLTERLQTAEGQVANARNLVDAKTKQIQSLARRIEKAEEERSKLATHLSERQAYITRMESTDEHFKAWADTRLPDAACKLLQFPAASGADGRPLPDCGATGDPGTASAEGARLEKQAPSRNH